MVSKKYEEEASKEGSEAAGWKKERWYGTSHKVIKEEARRERQQAYVDYPLFVCTTLRIQSPCQASKQKRQSLSVVLPPPPLFESCFM